MSEPVRPVAENGSEVQAEERGVPLGLAVLIILVLLAVLGAGGVAIGYRYFWNQYQGPRVWDTQIARWELALKKDPKDVEGWVALGQAYFNKGMLKEAEQAYRKAQQLNPQAKEINYFLGQVKMRQHRYAEAEKLFRQVAEIAPGNPLPHHALAEALVAQKKFAEALKEADWILTKIDPTLVEVHYVKGVALEGLRRKKEAAQSFIEALRYDPSYQPARDAAHRLGLKDKDLPAMPSVTAGGQIVPVKPGEPGSVAGMPVLPGHPPTSEGGATAAGGASAGTGGDGTAGGATDSSASSGGTGGQR